MSEDPPADLWTTLASLPQQDPRAFAAGLMDFLRAQVPVSRGFEDCREDAIGDVVARVLERAEAESLPLADALRDLRRSSTRAWVAKLISVYRRRGGREASPGREPAAPAPPEPGEGAGEGLARVAPLLDELREAYLTRSRPSTRKRRRLVWEVFMGSLLQGVHLTRREVVEAVRGLGVSRRKASEGQLLADLDRIALTLREHREPEG